MKRQVKENTTKQKKFLGHFAPSINWKFLFVSSLFFFLGIQFVSASNLKPLFGERFSSCESKKSKIVSIGHRNPQGLFYSKRFDFILSTEHGPKGGDEINLNHSPFDQIKNFGWPIASYGDHYHKNYSEKILKEAPLNKSHKKFGFEEPIKYFDPSIGISQTISLNETDTEFFNWSNGK